MSLLVANCPRCGSQHVTFDVTAEQFIRREYGWQPWYEVFSICRACHKPTIFLISLSEAAVKDVFAKPNAVVRYEHGLNQYFKVRIRSTVSAAISISV
jgi:hypothetical protein